MYTKPAPPASEAAAFEADYITATLRARRDFTWAQRAAAIALLTTTAPAPHALCPDTPEPRLRSFGLILARCESAATLLSWRKEISPEQKLSLDSAVQRLQQAASEVIVRAAPHPMLAKRAKFRPLYRAPGR